MAQERVHLASLGHGGGRQAKGGGTNLLAEGCPRGGRGSRRSRVRRQAGALLLTPALTLGTGGNQSVWKELTQ
eukprot:1940281-Prorocentrum_lima.AAC.1